MSIYHENQTVDRRRFLQVAAGGAAALTAMPGILRAQEDAPAETPATTQPVPPAKAPFGKTGYEMTRVSFGAILIKPPAGVRLLQTAIDRGMNAVHTALGYGRGGSVQAIGALFNEHPEYRQKVFLCLKVSNVGSEEEIDKALAAMNTDHADMLFPQIHKADEGDLDKLVEFNEAMVKKGKGRFKAFACHDEIGRASCRERV